MAPPELTGDAPVVDVFHPVEVGLREALGDELDRAVLDDADGFLGQGLHLDEPLRGDERLDIVMAAVAGADVVGIGLGLDQIPLLLKVLDEALRHS